MSDLKKLKDAYLSSLAASSEAYLVFVDAVADKNYLLSLDAVAAAVTNDADAAKTYLLSLNVVAAAEDAYADAYRAYLKAKEDMAHDDLPSS